MVWQNQQLGVFAGKLNRKTLLLPAHTGISSNPPVSQALFILRYCGQDGKNKKTPPAGLAGKPMQSGNLHGVGIDKKRGGA